METATLFQQVIMSAVLGVRPLNSRAARRTAASSRNSESITSMSRMRGAYGRTPLVARHHGGD